MSIIGRLGGKKFLAAIGAVLTVILTNLLHMDAQVAELIVGTAIAYITVQGVSDIKTGGITSSQTMPVDLETMKRIELAIATQDTLQAQHEAEQAKHEAEQTKHEKDIVLATAKASVAPIIIEEEISPAEKAVINNG